MDGAAAPRVIESSPQRLAVGVRDAGLGWVEIRTHAAGGQIGAVVGTGSAASHQALAEELPSMREYLAGQQVKVGHLAAENFSAMGGGQRGNASGGQGSGHASTGSQNSGSQNSGSQNSGSQSSGNAGQDVARRARAEAGVQAVFAGGGLDETLSYISVRV
jgi:flagellar hook-length control protein FliK